MNVLLKKTPLHQRPHPKRAVTNSTAKKSIGKSKVFFQQTAQAKKEAIKAAALKVLNDRKQQANGRNNRGFVQSIIASQNLFTRDELYNALRSYKNIDESATTMAINHDSDKQGTPDSTSHISNTDSSGVRKKGGRPKGSTNESIILQRN